MNRTLETDLFSLAGAKSLDPAPPLRQEAGQGEAFKFSLLEAGTELSAPIETDASSREVISDAAPLPAWMIQAEEIEVPPVAAADRDLAEIASTDLLEKVENILTAEPEPAPEIEAETEVQDPILVAVPAPLQMVKTAPEAGAEFARPEPAEEIQPHSQIKAADTQAPALEADDQTELAGSTQTEGEPGTDTGTGSETGSDTSTAHAIDLTPDTEPQTATEPDPGPSDAPRSDFAALGTSSATGTTTDHAIHAATTGDTAGRVEGASGITDTTTATPAMMTSTAPAATPTTSAPATTFAVPPGQPMLAATPAEVVSIITDNVSGTEDPQDRIVVRLDPPELGRVSIDFKIDAQGVQHITVTGETPEAMRHLRAMHFELVQALERQGLSSGDMTFQQQSSNGQNGGTSRTEYAGTSGGSATELTETPVRLASPPPRNTQPPSSGGGLNIRL